MRIPTPLRKYTGGKDAVTAEGTSIAAVLADLDRSCPGLRERICEADGSVRRFVNLYVNGDDIRFLDNVNSPVKDGDEVSIVPAIAGGTPAMTGRAR
ncbi:MAG TPA: MoaD/ThiS family protein [Candidatus Limnocylindrales bacterium]|nr:MoaD/ThiS family protein [Candidatus Limnocylindrales bacterium]